MDFTSPFASAIASAGLTPPPHILANSPALVRFRYGSESKKNGYYRLTVLRGPNGDDLAFGVFGCWKRGVEVKWTAKDPAKYTPFDRERQKQEHERVRKAAEEKARTAAIRAHK